MLASLEQALHIYFSFYIQELQCIQGTSKDLKYTMMSHNDVTCTPNWNSRRRNAIWQAATLSCALFQK